MRALEARAVAIALKGGAWRPAGLAKLASELAKGGGPRDAWKAEPQEPGSGAAPSGLGGWFGRANSSTMSSKSLLSSKNLLLGVSPSSLLGRGAGAVRGRQLTGELGRGLARAALRDLIE